MRVLHKVYNKFNLKLFYTPKDCVYFILFLGVIFTFSILLKYYSYYQITKYNYYKTTATVLKSYPKDNKQILKIKLDEGTIGYTIYHGYENILYRNKISLILTTQNINFIDMFKPNFINTFKIKIVSNKQNVLIENIQEQHSSKKMKEFFGAIFVATPVSLELREDIQKFGISHLVAISGFHLSIISFILYLIFFYLYKPLYIRCFAYRNIYIDSMIFVILGLSLYLYVLGFIPSLVRSFVMMLFGLFLFIRNIKIVSFETLGVVFLFLLSLFPSLIFSIGFWFSFAGVFYIFLFLRYVHIESKLLLVILLNIWIYILMIPVVHYFFIDFSSFELYSPIFSFFFNLFYPLEIFLHILGIGGILDTLLEYLFSYSSHLYEMNIPLSFLFVYILTSLLSVYDKIFLYGLFLLSFFIMIMTLC